MPSLQTNTDIRHDCEDSPVSQKCGQLLSFFARNKTTCLCRLLIRPRSCLSKFCSSKLEDTCCGCKQLQKDKKTTDVNHVTMIHSPAAPHLSCSGSGEVQWLSLGSWISDLIVGTIRYPNQAGKIVRKFQLKPIKSRYDRCHNNLAYHIYVQMIT